MQHIIEVRAFEAGTRLLIAKQDAADDPRGTGMSPTFEGPMVEARAVRDHRGIAG
jgi:hypothetical protein